jgi:hypothetical protein
MTPTELRRDIHIASMEHQLTRARSFARFVTL